MIHLFYMEISWGFHNLKDILDVVLIPAVLVLLPLRITQQWQDKQRDSETKTRLVAEISELVMTTVMTLYVLSIRKQLQNDALEQELDKIYKQWMVETCVIGSKLHAYFPDDKKGDEQIHKKWDFFSKDLSYFYKKWREEINRIGEKDHEKEKEKLFDRKAKIIAEILTSKITGFQYK